MNQVSVIIPTYNRPENTIKAISSVLSQTRNENEIIVVDDGSTDGTREALDPLIGDIIYIRHPFNQGVSAARNTGILAAGAPYISFLDSDDLWLPRKLEEQLNFFSANPDAKICQTEEVWIRNGVRVNPMKKHRKRSGEIFEHSLALCLVSPSAVMLKRDLINELGLFDEELLACEDYDLWLRISCRYPVHLIPKRLVIKRGGAADQLSGRYIGIDLYRIRALVKVLESGKLDHKQFECAYEELEAKCNIYSKGCLKRGKIEEGAFYLEITRRYTCH